MCFHYFCWCLYCRCGPRTRRIARCEQRCRFRALGLGFRVWASGFGLQGCGFTLGLFGCCCGKTDQREQELWLIVLRVSGFNPCRFPSLLHHRGNIPKSRRKTAHARPEDSDNALAFHSNMEGEQVKDQNCRNHTADAGKLARPSKFHAPGIAIS